MEAYKGILIIAIYAMIVSAVFSGLRLYAMWKGEKTKDVVKILQENYPYMTVEDAEKIFDIIAGFYKWHYLTLGALLSNILPLFISIRVIKELWL